jgi:hypothetical protein
MKIKARVKKNSKAARQSLMKKKVLDARRKN